MGCDNCEKLAPALFPVSVRSGGRYELWCRPCIDARVEEVQGQALFELLELGRRRIEQLRHPALVLASKLDVQRHHATRAMSRAADWNACPTGEHRASFLAWLLEERFDEVPDNFRWALELASGALAPYALVIENELRRLPAQLASGRCTGCLCTCGHPCDAHARGFCARCIICRVFLEDDLAAPETARRARAVGGAS